MKCPKCGYQRQSRDNEFAPPTECPACGIVYAKYGPSGASATEPSQAHPSVIKKPSPVDESTLRQARERVERRLRKKAGVRDQQDDQRAQTLKRARTLAAEGVRKRQQEWRHRRPAEAMADDTPQRDEASPPQTMQVLADQLLAPVIAPAIALHAEPTQDASDVATAVESAAQAAGITTRAEAATPDHEAQENASEAPAPEEESAGEANTRVFRTGARQAEDGPAAEATPALIDTAQTDADEQPTVEAIAAERFRRFPRENSRGGLMRLFQVVAWFILLAGVAGAVLSWVTLKDVQAGMPGLGPMGPNNLPVALLLGFAYLATGVLGFAFFWVTSMISGQLSEIRKLLLRGSM